ncbi:MAG: YdbC family protein [Clostridia bacterium]|nr:hypothetical protein [Clostridiaceae bacterium]
MSDIVFEIVKSLGVLSESPKGWRKEVNLVSWNGRAPKIDIREWAPDHERAGKGITLNEEEWENLKKIMTEE